MSSDQDVPEGFDPVEPSPGFGTAFGLVYAHRSDSGIGFRVAEHHLNPFGACHGGALATFADTQIIAVRGKVTTQADHTPTINLSVDYLAPARLGDWVEAEVMLAKRTSTMLFTQALLRVDGVLVARSTGIYRHYERRPAERTAGGG
jgi:uncharacterized protein (TIGR00369 family)